LSALDGLEIVEVPFDDKTGMTDVAELERVANDRLLCTVAGFPNAFGVIEPLKTIVDTTHRAGALAISVTTEPLALGLLRAPGELGVDIAVGEAQSVGLPLQYGGPGVGFLAARMTHLRQMPGRLIGQTRDRDGRRAFTLTLATREQHIRRERATSNICTNHSLCALAVTVYLSLMGKQGLRDLAERNVELAHQAADVLQTANIERRFSGPFFNEFTVKVARPTTAIEQAEKKKILAGLPLGIDYPELSDALLIAVTEMNHSDEFSPLAAAIAEVR
jgi:glycine dehydrogenase subunit 1